MGQAVYTSHFMFFGPEQEKRVYSTIPARLPLDGHRFSRSQRKLWRRNAAVFRIEVGSRASFDEDKQRVNSLYAKEFPRRAIGDPEDILSNGKGRLALDTREVAIYDGEQLAAFSFFDMGHRSMYSKQGIYDPSYRKYSLGFFTMLAEISYAQEQGLSFYYPGYVVPGNAEFDYKHRIGPLEYFELKSSSWKPFSELQENDIPIHYLRRQLRGLQEALKARGVRSQLFDYRFFDIRFYDSRPYPFLEHPCFLLPDSKHKESLCPVTVFDPVKMKFQVCNCRFFGLGIDHLSTYRQAIRSTGPAFKIPAAVFDILNESCTLEEALATLMQIAPV